MDDQYAYRRVEAIKWSPNGEYLAFVTYDYLGATDDWNNTMLNVVDYSSGQLKFSRRLDTDTKVTVVGISWSVDSSMILLLTHIGEVKWFEVENGNFISEWSVSPGSTPFVSSFSHSFDGNFLAVVTSDDYSTTPYQNRLQVFNSNAGDIVYQTQLPGAVGVTSYSWMAWSPNGNQLALLSSNAHLFVGNWSSGILSINRDFDLTSHNVASAIVYGGWGPDGRLLALTSGNAQSQLGIFDTATGDLVFNLTQSADAGKLIWNHQSGMIVAQILLPPERGSKLRVWDSQTGDLLGENDYGQYVDAFDWHGTSGIATGRVTALNDPNYANTVRISDQILQS